MRDLLFSVVTPGRSACNGENMSATQQFLCMYGHGFNPALQAIYITGSPQWRMQKLASLLDKAGSDYLLTPGMGAHKLHRRKLSWSKARKICIKEGGEFFSFFCLFFLTTRFAEYRVWQTEAFLLIHIKRSIRFCYFYGNMCYKISIVHFFENMK